MVKKAEEKFSISYDADTGDFKKHEIDALTLGRSIIGVHKAVTEATGLIAKGAQIDLKVSTPVREGSVVIDFLAFASTPGALEVLKYIGLSAAGGAIGGGSLIEVIKAIKNRKIARVTVEDDSDIATIEVDGGTIKCNKHIARLAVDKGVREAMHDVVQAPIAGQKSAKFKVIDSSESVVVTVGEAAAHNFSPLPIGSLESEETITESTTVYFVQVNFESEKGWRVKFADGKEHAVVMADATFMAKVVQNKQSFSKQDLFEVEIEKHSIYRQERSTHKYTVNKVTKHFAEKGRRLV